MRLRVQTTPPLPQLKAWFIPEFVNSSVSILDLKHALCRQLQLLKRSGVDGRDILLSLEGFELLDDSPLDVVRDGDLVSISLRPDIKSNKRKAPQQDSPRVKKRKRSSSYTSTSSSSSSEPSDSTSSVSSSSSSSSSSSPSSSSSSLSSQLSSSSPSRPPKPLNQVRKTTTPSRTVVRAPKPIPSPSVNVTQHVPPGFGKPSTRSRNLRRRLKKQHDSQSKAPPPPPKGSSSTNLLPLGSKPHHKLTPTSNGQPEQSKAWNGEVGGYEPDTGDARIKGTIGYGQWNNGNGDVMMSSLKSKNKNKKKGTLNGPLPRKIIFHDHPPTQHQEPHEYDPQSGLEHSKKPIETASATNSALMAPSERQSKGELPPNMFVTWVDVEEGVTENTRKKRKQKKYREEMEDEEWVGEDSWYDDVALEATTAAAAGANISYFGGVDQTLDPGIDGDPKDAFDWDRAEKAWDGFVDIQSKDQFAFRGLVGWKALAINPATFTPEVLLSVARLIRVSDANDQCSITVLPLVRPITATTPFMFGHLAEPGADEVVAEEVYDWNAVLDMKWKVVDVWS